ncbi:MAG: glycosyltransferase [Bacteroidota bacterium]
MMHLHVISFDVPYPPNYGGVIDVYYKVKALAEEGAKVHLHSFSNGREESEDLKRLCERVYYYPRIKPAASLPLRVPHIISSRKSSLLLDHLMEDSYPILFEGMHTCFYLTHTYLKFRVKIVRMHNIEWEYYGSLAEREPSWSKQQYLLRESQLLKKYERRLTAADRILGISPKDTDYLSKRFNQVDYLPAFHPNDQVTCKPGKGKYCLYHGNLQVAENHEAAMYLIDGVFHDMKIPLIIAGSNPRPELITAISDFDHISLFHNPGEGEMLDLIRSAHIHVLPTFQATGIKLKLLKALFNGRFVAVTPFMVQGNDLGKYCIVAQDTLEYKSLIARLFKYEFSEREIETRRELLDTRFSNRLHAKKLIQMFSENE